jgi:hypothetical protein
VGQRKRVAEEEEEEEETGGLGGIHTFVFDV